MEVIGKRNGLWLNAVPGFNFSNLNTRIFLNVGTAADGGGAFVRLSNDGTGNNIGYICIGVQLVPTTPIDAARRLEVFDAVS
ncbi:MAG: hypothetical protein JNK61_02925 [Bacteroidia bacterium]|nr:hypothetical protein [Bacteroidia bacterium]